MNTPLRVFLIDDQDTVLKALSRLLASAGFDVAPFHSAQEFLDADMDKSRGCLVLDRSMPGIDGMALQQVLQARGSLLPVIFLTGHGDIETSVQAMKSGAADFLTKPVDAEKLLGAVRRALARNLEHRRDQSEVEEIRSRVATLTAREREVMEQVVKGLLNKQIAALLGAAEKTIKVHRARVMTKMKAASVADLVRLADRAGGAE